MKLILNLIKATYLFRNSEVVRGAPVGPIVTESIVGSAACETYPNISVCKVG